MGPRRAVREWVGEKLITKGDVRSQVLRGAGSSEGLPNETIAELVDAHLVRAEQRSGAVWYELAHDRLIEPVRKDNKAWLDLHLERVQKVAAIWATQGQPSGLLFTGEELEEAKRWAAENAPVTEGERKFLEASEAAQAALDKERRQARRLRWQAIGATAVSIVAVIAGLVAWRSQKATVDALQLLTLAKERGDALQTQTAQKNQDLLAAQKDLTEEQKKLKATGEKLEASLEDAKSASAEARRQLYIGTWQAAVRQAAVDLPGHVDDDRSILLARQAMLLHDRTGGPAQPRYLIEYQLQQAIQAPALSHVLSGHNVDEGSVAFGPDGNRLASAGYDGAVRVWDMRQPTNPPLVLSGHTAYVGSVAFGPDGNRLASASYDRTVRVWDLGQPTAPPLVLSGDTRADVTSVAFGPDGNRLASASEDRTVRVWPLWTAAADYLCTRAWRNLSMEEWKFYIGESFPYELTCPNLPPGVGAPGAPK